MRLNKYLASVGVASRRKADELINSGLVKVNGKIANLGMQVEPGVDEVSFLEKKVPEIESKVYLLLNKPAGVVSTLSDPNGRKTVSDLLKITERVFPVGRLDYETTGLLLLTNDGELAYRLTHPKYEVPKTYHLLIEGKIESEVIDKLADGVRLEDGMTGPAEVKILEEGKEMSVLEMTISEGKKREIRRMCEALEINLVSLKRVAEGGLRLGKLAEGKYRVLSDEEVESLRKLVGLTL